MQLPQIPLFDWLIENIPEAKLDLASSSITGVRFDELQEMTGFELPEDFDLGKNDPFGALELRDALVSMYNCDHNQVVTTTGGSEANFLVFLALLDRGDEIIVEQPGYSPLWLVPEMLGARVVKWERRFEDGFALDMEALKSKLTKNTKLIVITNLNNPTGVQADQKTIQAVAELASEHGALLFIDEMFLPAANAPQRTAAGMDSVIVTSSVSKVYGIGGLRTGWIVADEDIAKLCLNAKWQTSVAAPYLSELISAAAISNARDKLAQRCKDIAHRNFSIVHEWIENNNDLLNWVPPGGGIMCYPRYNTKTQIGSVDLCRRFIQEQGVLVSPGEYFGLDGHFRLTFMNPVDELESALDKIALVLRTI